MPTEQLTADKPKRLPRWLVGVVVLATAGVTVWAMSMTRLRGPQLSWDRAREAVEAAWEEGAGPAPVGGYAAGEQTPGNPWPTGAARPVAGFTGIPPIVAGAPAPHPDRGACTNCHSVSSPQGLPVASIRAHSTMPHGYR